jgi:hypothetical protein
VFLLSSQLLSSTFLILLRIQGGITTHVDTSSSELPVILAIF